MAMLAVVWLVNIIVRKKRVNWNVLWLLMILFGVVSLMMNMRASFDIHVTDLETMWLYWVRMILYSLFLPIVWSVVNWYGEGRRYTIWMLIMGFALLVIGFLQLIFLPNIIFLAQYGWDPHVGRMLSTFLDPNFLGALLTFFFAICFAFYFRYKSWADGKKLFWLILSGLFATGVALTFSRSAFLSLGVVFVILSYMFDKRILLFGMVAGLMVFFGSPRIMERVEGIYNVDLTAQKRIASWENNWNIIEDNLWYGVGYNNLLSENIRRGFVTDAKLHSGAGSDSSYLTVWSTMGLAGLFSYLLFWIVSVGLLWNMYMNRKNDPLHRWLSIGVAAGILGVMVHAQFTNSLLYNHIYMVILFAVGLCMGWRSSIFNKQ
jgi:O-antigen ligase